MEALIAQVEEAILPLLEGPPFVFFGHSMGAGIAFELTHSLLLRGRKLPAALIVSSAKAPAIRTPVPEPSDTELIAQLKKLGGAPEGATEDLDWMRLVFPALRADTRLYRRWQPKARNPLPVPIFAYCGDSDPNLSADNMERWKEETSAEFKLRIFSGGHFYFQPDATELLSTISEDGGTAKL